ncbi:MAG: protein kinase [Planctomycetaceae bacterium]|nr:protein kinase [Planctomycetaceae bacterium]
MSEADRQPPTIPGYTLTTRLGAGGYGEVWLAHAPGGLTKAVKIIFGAFDGRRAELELRSLHRIKMVRHPFLLSLERIEVVDNRLAIVTELADSSLKDRFDECRHGGQTGVPRGELLGYLRDAADALDFLSTRHSLQHLDVKPENLLIVGGHIKVADFGLVKEVGRTQASLVGGLTPLYSSPEVFQGTPGARSDQYSLAVVYQEMLTGIAPFAGLTAAELTIQHLQSEPDLASLPMQDRFVIARALAKNPTQRFASCTEMVDALFAATVADEPASAANAEEPQRSFDDCVSAFPDRRAEPRPGPVAEFLDERVHADGGRGTAVLWSAAENDGPPTRQTIALSNEADAFRAPPTAVIGVGGLAGRVMRQLRSRLAREVGDDHREGVAMLLLDSDSRGISAAVQGNDRTALRPDETVTLPLRRPQEYREDSALLMRWLSRRWLYNIPKSLRTEGLRPLGRLAFVDHSRQIGERLRLTLDRARRGAETSEAPTPTADASTNQLRVYVVAGVSGGTGSGMSLDVGYAVRAMAAKQGLDDVEVIGLFLHATGRDAQQNDLAKVNSFAWLREYNHYHRANGVYPGDEGCGLPAFASGKKAFDAAYFLDLGVAVDDDALNAAASEVAEYLYLDAATPAQQFFSACRAGETNDDYAPLRSFMLSTASAADDRAIHAAAISISRAVLMEYLGCGPTRSDALPAAEAIDLATLAGRTREAIETLLASKATPAAAEPFQLGAFIRAVDDDFAAPDERPGTFVAGCSLEEITGGVAAEMADTLTASILHQVDERGARLAGATGMLESSRQRLQQLGAESTKLAGGIAQQAVAATAQLDRWQRERSTSEATVAREREFGEAYRRLRIDQHAMLAAAAVARRLSSELRTIGDRLGEFGRQVKGFVHQFPQTAAIQGSDPFAAAVIEQLPHLAATVDAQLDERFTTPMGGLMAVAMGSPRVREQLGAELLRLATWSAEQLASSPALLAAVALPTASDGGGELIDGVRMPAVPCAGGKFAVLETHPATNGSAQWESTPQLAKLAGVGSQAVRCCETWSLSLPRVAMSLIDGRRECIEFADRVSSRCDVPWMPLSVEEAPLRVVAPAFPVEATPMAMTQVL